MLYDTLKLAEDLEGPFSREQAMALTRALTVSTTDTLATKSDLKELRAELKGDIAALKIEIAGVKGEIAGSKGEIASLRSEIAGVKTDMVKWIVGAISFNLFGTAGLILTLSKYTH